MKILTLWQPWASLIIEDKKHFETRSWATSYRGPLGIHASQKQPSKLTLDRSAIECFIKAGMIDKLPENRTFNGEYMTNWKDDLELGVILGHINLVDCIRITEAYSAYVKKYMPNEYAFGDYTPGRWAWALSDPVKLPVQIPAKGMQRLWEYDI